MHTYPKEETTISSSNILIQDNKEKSEDLSMLVKISGKLYFKLKEKSYLVELLEELKNSNGTINRDKIFEFIKQNKNFIINSPKFINMLSQYKIIDKFNPPIMPNENEENKKLAQKLKISEEENMDKQCNYNEICEKEINLFENNNEMSSLANNEEFQNISNFQETEENSKKTKEETKSEKNENEEINKLKNSIDKFSKDIKIKLFSLNESIDTLICDISLFKFEYLKQFSNTILKDWISPILIQQYYYISLPNWANNFKSFNFSCIIFIILLL